MLRNSLVYIKCATAGASFNALSLKQCDKTLTFLDTANKHQMFYSKTRQKAFVAIKVAIKLVLFK